MALRGADEGHTPAQEHVHPQGAAPGTCGPGRGEGADQGAAQDRHGEEAGRVGAGVGRLVPQVRQGAGGAVPALHGVLRAAEGGLQGLRRDGLHRSDQLEPRARCQQLPDRVPGVQLQQGGQARLKSD